MISIEFLRQFRFGEYALFDFFVAFLGVYLLAPLLSKLFLKLRVDISRTSWLLLTLPISIIVHVSIGRITPMTKNFLDIQDHYILKIFILSLMVFGLKGIKITKRKKKILQ